MGFDARVVAGGEDEVKILEKARRSVDQIEVIFSGTGDDPHHVFAVQGVEYARNASDETRRLTEPSAVERIALVPQEIDVA
jgi:hypothetical protein